MNNNPLLSIIVLTYGHENYIRKALDSVLMQQVNFDYEIIVGEDCSPDNTRVILREFEEKYPDKFIMIYREKNIGARNNVQDLYTRCKGKYIALLEGDDYWLSHIKLQMQVDYLEANEDCIATAHRVVIIDEVGNIIPNKTYPECQESLYTFKHYIRGILPGQSGTIVSRNIYNSGNYDKSIFKDKSLVPGDKVKIFVLASYGRIYCFPEVWGAYRHVTHTGTSFSATTEKNKSIRLISDVHYYNEILKYSKKINNNEKAIRAAEQIYIFAVLKALQNNKNGYKLLMKTFFEIKYKTSAIYYIITSAFSWPYRYFRYKKYGNI